MEQQGRAGTDDQQGGTRTDRRGIAGTGLQRDQDWRAEGLCGGRDPDLWFAVGALEHRQAKQICRSCPVQKECLSYAMDHPVDHGIWGGLTERERLRWRRRAGQAGWRSLIAS